MNSKKKTLECVGLGLTVMWGIYWGYAVFLEAHLPAADGAKRIMGLLCLYGLGFGLFLLITGRLPNHAYTKNKMRKSELLFCFLLQFSALMVLSILVNAAAALGFRDGSAELNTISAYSLFMLLVFNPMIEEILFRKLLADKLLQYGARFYILASAFCFAVVHAVSLGIPQVVYTFLLGLIWAYILVKTGNLKIVIFLHACSNLFGSILTQFLMGKSMVLAGIYALVLMAAGAAGCILLLISRKKIRLDGTVGLLSGSTAKDVLENKGIWAFVLTVLIMVMMK